MLLKNKDFLFRVVAFFVLYFLILPNFWPEPEIEVKIPAEASRLDNEIPVTITISSWHSNVDLLTVDLTLLVDQKRNNSKEVLSEILLQEDQQKNWENSYGLGFNHIIWPQKFQYDVLIPLKTVREKGLLGDKPLQGSLYIKATYPRINYGFALSEELTKTKEFTLNLH